MQHPAAEEGRPEYAQLGETHDMGNSQELGAEYKMDE